MSRMTGRTCYRVTWLGRLVLQVEVDVTGSPWVSQMDIGLHTSWRDARCEDFNVFGNWLFNKAPIPHPGQKPHVPLTNPPASPAKETL